MKRPNAAPGPGDVEILVHITGPATAADDRHYRALAGAYLGFDPASRTRLATSRSATTSHNQPRRCPSRAGTPRRSNHAGLDGPEQNELDSPQLSFSEVWGNNNSPRLNTIPTGQASDHTSPGARQDANQPDSWIPPPSEVADSLPLNHTGILEFSSPSRLIHHFMQGPGSSQFESQHLPSPGKVISGTPAYPPCSVEVIPATSSDAPTAPAIADPQDDDDDISNVVQDTPVAPRCIDPPQTSEVGSDVDIIEDTVLEETPAQPTKRPLARAEARASSEPLTNKRQRITPSSSFPGTTLTRSASDTDAPVTTSEHPLVLRDNGNGAYLSLLEIEAPGPTIGTSNMAPDSLITANLSALAQSLDMSRRYRPTETLRDVRPYERGYWLLDCREWDQILVQRTWGFLHNYISQGFAGWGSRCVRDEDWAWIRVWCFGHVIGHVYLLLYLASERKLKTQGATWIDGGGEVTVVTEGRA